MPETKVLIVEDEVIIAAELEEALDHMGLQVTGIATSGEEALALASGTSLDLVIMDIKLKSSMDGIETAHRLREKQRHLPVVFITAYSDESLLERAKAIEPYAYLLKPVQYRELSTAIIVTLNRAACEAELKRSEELFRTMIDFTYDWETWRGPDNSYVYVSPSCERITGYPPEAFVANPWLVEEIVHPQDRDAFSRHIRVPDEKTVTDAMEFRIITKGGEERWISHNCQPVHSQDGIWLGRRASYRDITERKRLEMRLGQDAKLESLGLVAGGVAHNYHNILKGVLDYCELAMSAMDNSAPGREHVQSAMGAARQGVELSRQILSHSSRDLIRLLPLDLGPFLERLLPDWRNTLAPDAEINLQMPPALPQIEASAGHLERALENLITNAKESLPQSGGKVRIALSLRKMSGPRLRRTALYEDQEPGEYVALEVSDNGQGMDPSDLPQLFGSFFPTKFYGRGLGLGVVLGVVRAHQGTMDVHSQPGGGTTFVLYFKTL